MVKRLVVVVAFAAGLAAWAAQAANAWYSVVSGSMACSGVVSWTATAWSGPTPASRENPEVYVWVSTDGGSTYTQVGTGAFDAADGYSFSGTWSNAGAATTVTLKVQEQVPWPGDGGDTPGPPHYATVVPPSNCSGQGGGGTTTPPSSSPPPQSSGPSRTGYCDASGKFWNLIVGQNTQPPYDQMHLRPADVNPTTGALYCAAPPPPRTGYCDSSGMFWNLYVGENVQSPYNQMNLRPADVNPTTGALYCAAPASPAAQPQGVAGAHYTKKKAHKAKHAKRHKVKARVKATRHARTLPFTK